VRRRSYAVILLDEIEKAHPEVFNVLLQIMDDGRLTDAKGRTVDFRNCIVIMSGNVGATLIKREGQIGFRKSDDARSSEQEYERMRERVMAEVKNVFRPEFLNRVDLIVVFKALSKLDVLSIVDIELKRVHKQLEDQQITFEISKEAKEWLVDKGYDPDFGARPLRRVIQTSIEDELAERLLAGKLKTGGTVTIAREGDDLKIDTTAPEAPPPAPEAEKPAPELAGTPAA
jgi:ATP-dependent Clp protease ATP-binding subunit ClpC